MSGRNAIKLFWRMIPPNDPKHKSICEKLLKDAAEKKDADIAIVRHSIHRTTKIKGKYVKTFPHVTGDVKNSTTGETHSLHYYLEEDEETPKKFPDQKPNPKFWPKVEEEDDGKDK